VFILGASNSTTSYDAALEDRLMHLPVPDPRNDKKAKTQLAQIMVDAVGLMPTMVKSMEMNELLDRVVLPMYDVLDTFTKGGSTAGNTLKGKSTRNLIGQAKLREIQTPELRELIDANNREAIKGAKWQYVVLASGKHVDTKYISAMPKIPVDKLTPLQHVNFQLNSQLVELEAIRHQKEGATPDDDDTFLSGF
jgi:hypothetical protein